MFTINPLLALAIVIYWASLLHSVCWAQESPLSHSLKQRPQNAPVIQEDFIRQNEDVIKKKRDLLGDASLDQAQTVKNQAPPAMEIPTNIDGDDGNLILDPGEEWKIETSHKGGFLGIGKWRDIYKNKKGEIKIDVAWGRDKKISLDQLVELMNGETITIDGETVALKTEVAQEVPKEERRLKPVAGSRVGVGRYEGFAVGPKNGFFGVASGKVDKTKEGAVTVNATLDKGVDFASWGYDFKNTVDVKNKTLVLYVKGTQNAQMRLQFRDLAWHNAGKFDTVQAWSDPITFTGDWQEIRIPMSQINGNIDLTQLKHIAIEFGGRYFNNDAGVKIQLGDPDKNLPAFVFTEGP